MEQDDFLWLQQWYHTHCNGDWEHGSGIHLGTLDNPGWSLTVNLQDTELEDKKFKEITLERSENDWVICMVKDGNFEGRCGPENLPEVLKSFRDWTENCKGMEDPVMDPNF